MFDICAEIILSFLFAWSLYEFTKAIAKAFPFIARPDSEDIKVELPSELEHDPGFEIFTGDD